MLSEAMDDIRNAATSATHSRVNAMVVGQAITNPAPRQVATPLPP